jgi:hypothetical protein
LARTLATKSWASPLAMTSGSRWTENKSATMSATKWWVSPLAMTKVVGDPVGEDVGDKVVGDLVGEEVGDDVVGEPVGCRERVGDVVGM